MSMDSRQNEQQINLKRTVVKWNHHVTNKHGLTKRVNQKSFLEFYLVLYERGLEDSVVYIVLRSKWYILLHFQEIFLGNQIIQKVHAISGHLEKSLLKLVDAGIIFNRV